jgi:3-deoxy-D-manno-octulosonic-acid transferase
LPAVASALEAAAAAAGHRPVLLAASTHAGEERAVLAAFADLAGRPDTPRLVIVPRHPIRGPEVADLARETGLTVRRQGAGEPFDGRAAVHVADALGELGLWFRLACATFVGGSFVAGVGGHNPLEPARLATPIIAGPHVANWDSVYAGLGAGVVRIEDIAGLTRAWADALDDPQSARTRTGVAAAAAAQDAEALATAAARLKELLR